MKPDQIIIPWPDPDTWGRKRRMKKWPDPTPKMLQDPKFTAIWNVIKKWDIAVPKELDGSGLYSGATGNHVRAILDGLNRGGKA